MPNMSRAAWGFMQSGDFPVPVGHWKFGKNTGTVAYDSSPNGNDGTIHGASWVKGYLGPGLSFDQLDDYVNFGDILNFAARAPFSIGVYIKPLEPTASYTTVLVRERATPTRDGYTIEVSRDTPRILFIRSVAGAVKSATYAIEWNTPYRVMVTYDGSTLRLYVNGSLANSQGDTRSLPAFSINLMMGNNPTLTKDFYGVIDETIIWDEALTADHIRQWDQGYR